MFCKKKQMKIVSVVFAAALVLSGCTSSSAAAEPVRESIRTRYHANRWREDTKKYTKSDYDYLLAFQTEGYEQLPVEEFNRKVLDWDDEEAYHKTEDILIRVFNSLSEKDENADFLLSTLGNTWTECEKKHFNACQKDSAPWHNGYAVCETYGDVFGDSVLLSGGYADFSFDYNLDTGKNLKVGQRDDLLDSIASKLETYMKKQPVQALKKEKAMEKTLSAHLKELLKSMDKGVVWAGNIDLDYYWEAPYEVKEETTQVVESSVQDESGYTKEQYNLVMDRLKPKNYEKMSVSEFNRTINKVLSEDEGDAEGVIYAYEMVMSFLSEKDENWTYLHETVQRALDEYQARSVEVYTGKTTDFHYTGNIYIPLEEDVFGDKMEVGEIEGGYEFNYRITNADKLTVQAREEFIRSVNQKAIENVETAAKNGSVDKAKFKTLLESAGKEASNEYIEFTGCNLDYFEVCR